jgi:molecular chaperone HscB
LVKLSLKQNYFELFDLPVNPLVNRDDLAGRYRELQRTVHPDRFAAGSDHEQRLALQYTTLVNEAYDVLSSDLKRCIYLLKLNGVEISDTDNTTVEPAFLMQQIELREALDDIDQAEKPLEELANMRAQVSSILLTLMSDFTSHLGNESAASLELATIVVRKMQYMHKLITEIDLQEEELLDY